MRTVVGNLVDKQPKKQAIKLDDRMYIALVFVLPQPSAYAFIYSFECDARRRLLLNFQIYKIKGTG